MSDVGVVPFKAPSKPPQNSSSLSLLLEAEKLLNPETRRAALLMACLAFEAAAGEALAGISPNTSLAPRSASELIDELHRHSIIDDSDGIDLKLAFDVREYVNARVADVTVEPKVVTRVLEIVRRLNQSQASSEEVHFYESAAATVIRQKLIGMPQILREIEAATDLLEEVLGPSRGLVSAEWDRGEDGQGRPVVILRLSDFTGSVSTSFAFEELSRPQHMRLRLYRLWGDLLQIRNTKQLESILGAREPH